MDEDAACPSRALLFSLPVLTAWLGLVSRSEPMLYPSNVRFYFDLKRGIRRPDVLSI